MENSSRSGADRLYGAAPVAAVALAAAAVYLNSLWAPFHYDDYETVLNNRNIRVFGDLPSIFLHSPFRGVLFLTFALSYRISGADPFGFHLLNLFIHALNACLVHLLARRLSDSAGTPQSSRLTAFAAALLFAVHPAFTEAVTYVSSRSSILAATFYVGCVLAFLSFRRSDGAARRAALWAGAFALFATGLLTKELLATAPLMFLAADRLFGALRSAGRPQFLRALAFPHGPFLLVLAVGGAARIHSFATRELVGGMLPRGIWENVFTQMQVVVVYLRMLVAPYGLNLIHDFPTVRSFWEFPTPLAALFLAALVAIAILRAARDPIVSFGIAWYFISLLPSSSLIPFQEPLAEHHLYLPGVGFCVVAGVAAARLIALARDRASAWSKPAVAACVAVAALFAALTVARNGVWSDELRLWRDVVSKTPGSWATHYGYGDALRRDAEARQAGTMRLLARGDQGLSRREFHQSVQSLRDAVEQYTTTLVHRPDHVDSLLNRGICHAMLAQSGGGDAELSAAESDLRRVIEVAPGNTKARNNLGNVALLRKDYGQAERMYGEVLAADPTNLNANVNLGSLYLNQFKDRERARVHYERAYRVLLESREYERAGALQRMLRDLGANPK